MYYYQNSPVLYPKSPIFHQKSPVVYRNSPFLYIYVYVAINRALYFHQKNPVLNPKSPIFTKRALLSIKRPLCTCRFQKSSILCLNLPRNPPPPSVFSDSVHTESIHIRRWVRTVLQCVAQRCSVLQCVAVGEYPHKTLGRMVSHFWAVFLSLFFPFPKEMHQRQQQIIASMCIWGGYD